MLPVPDRPAKLDVIMHRYLLAFCMSFQLECRVGAMKVITSSSLFYYELIINMRQCIFFGYNQPNPFFPYHFTCQERGKGRRGGACKAVLKSTSYLAVMGYSHD